MVDVRIKPREALEQAVELIQEAKGIADPKGSGPATDHLDFAENWINTALAALSDGEAVGPVAWLLHKPGGTPYTTAIEENAKDWKLGVTPLYTSPPTSELEALRKRVAEIDAHRRNVLADNERLLNALIERDRRGAELEKALGGLLDNVSEKLSCGMRCQLEATKEDEDQYQQVLRTARRVREGGKVE
jgi:hypothetical protein